MKRIQKFKEKSLTRIVLVTLATMTLHGVANISHFYAIVTNNASNNEITVTDNDYTINGTTEELSAYDKSVLIGDYLYPVEPEE